MWEVLLDAFLDTLKLSWLLLIFYILIELIEQKIADKMHAKLKSNYAVAVGSVFGIVPQCGFSVLAADLYSRRQITLGAMLAVFIATSDEALPILLSNITQDGVWLKLLVLILSKLVLALAAGYAVDIVQKVVLKKRQVAVVAGSAEVAHNDHSDKHAHAHDEHSHEDEHIHEESCKEEEEHVDIHKGCCGHHIDDAKESNVKKYIVHPLLHTLKILAYILIINVIMYILSARIRLSSLWQRAEYCNPYW